MAKSMDMANATYAVSKQGLQKWRSNLEGDLSAAAKIIDPSKSDFKELTNFIDKYWVGTDAETFKSKIKASAEELKKSINNYKNYVQSCASNLLKDFEKAQQRNSDLIKNATFK